MTIIIPAILAKNTTELKKQATKIKQAKKIQIDICDGKFVKTKTLNFKQIKQYIKKNLPNKKIQLHLMTTNPEKYITNTADEIIFHAETGKNIINKIKKRKILAGIAINPKTPVNKHEKLIKKADIIQIMTVTPGKMGKSFQKNQIKKFFQIKKINTKAKIGFDGGINFKTTKLIKKTLKTVPDFLTIGSALQKTKNPKKLLLKINKTLSQSLNTC